MRAYDLTAASVALGLSRKKLDNLLARHALPGVPPLGRGRTRHIPRDALLLLAVALTLSAPLGTPEQRSLDLARQVLGAGGHPVQLSPEVAVTCDLGALARRLDQALERAVEMVIPRRRGRPPRTNAHAAVHRASAS